MGVSILEEIVSKQNNASDVARETWENRIVALSERLVTLESGIIHIRKKFGSSQDELKKVSLLFLKFKDGSPRSSLLITQIYSKMNKDVFNKGMQLQTPPPPPPTILKTLAFFNPSHKIADESWGLNKCAV